MRTYGIPRASLIDLYLHTKFHLNRTNFLCIYGRTYVRKDGQTSRPALLGRLLLGRLGGVDLTTTETRNMGQSPT